MQHARNIVLGLLLLFMVSCSTVATPGAVKTKPPAATAAKQSTQPGYPIPADNSAASPNYPAPTEPQNLPTITVIPNLGQVSGKILLRGEPMVGRNIYVCPIIKSPEGTKVAVRLDRSNPLNATIGETGSFLVPNIPAGEYGLVYDTGLDSVLLSDPKTQNQILFAITENSRIDLGTLNFDALPLP